MKKKFLTIVVAVLALNSCSEKNKKEASERESRKSPEKAHKLDDERVATAPKKDRNTSSGDEAPDPDRAHSDLTLRPPLKGTGVVVPDVKHPDHAEAVRRKMLKEIGNYKAADPRLASSLNRLLTDAWSDLDQSLMGSNEKLEGSKIFIEKIRSGKCDYLNSVKAHEAAYMMLTIAALDGDALSKTQVWLDYLGNLSEDAATKKSDVVIAHITKEAFRVGGHQDAQRNLRGLEKLSKSRNPVYRNLAASLGARMSLRPDQLVSFYEGFTNEQDVSVNENVILGLRKAGSKEALDKLVKLADAPQIIGNPALLKLTSEAIKSLDP